MGPLRGHRSSRRVPERARTAHVPRQGEQGPRDLWLDRPRDGHRHKQSTLCFAVTSTRSSLARAQVFLSDFAFRQLEDLLRIHEPDERQRSQERAQAALTPQTDDVYSPYSTTLPTSSGTQVYGNTNFAKSSSTAALPLVHHSGGGGLSPSGYDRKTFYDSDGEGDPFSAEMGAHHFEDDQSLAPTSGYAPSRPMFDPLGMPEKDLRGVAGAPEVVEEVEQTTTRRNWVIMTWLATWWIPSFLLSWIGGMKRKDVRMAWREKLLIKYADSSGERA